MVLLSARIRIIHSLLCCITVISLNAAEVIKGDDYAPDGTTFSFPVNKIVRDPIDDVIFIGAGQAGANIFALSGFHPTAPRVQPLVPETVMFNNVPDQPNPLFNQGIALLDLMRTTDARTAPLVVPEDNPTQVYLFRDFANFSHVSIYASNPLLDSNMQVTNKIVGLVGFRGGMPSAALVALTPAYTGIFGESGSAFTTVSFQQRDQEFPAEGDKPAYKKTVYTLMQGTGGAPFSYNSSAIKINSPVTSITNNLAMEWNAAVQRGYVGFQLVGGSDYSDGALSLMLVDVNHFNGVLTLYPFAPASAFDDAGDQIIGGLGASIPLSIQFVANMETSTGLSYVIVQGGNGTPEETANTVYALPIINARNRFGSVVDQTIHGVLASKSSPIYTFYDGFEPSRFMRRRFTQPATTPSQTPRSTDVAVQVGGGPISQGTIESMIVSNDAVIVSVSEASGYYNACKTGMFISQALFDENGVIKAWTPWQHIGGVTEPVFRVELSVDSGNITYFTGDSYTSINTINRTTWGVGSNPGLGSLATQINSTYTLIKGGVQGLVDLPFNTPGLNGISLLIAGGNNSVTLLETGSTQGDQQCPHTSGYTTDPLTFENGTISETITGSSLSLTIQGGALNAVGPVVTAAIGVNTIPLRNRDSIQEGYLFVGGSRGLAVLTAPDGSGWNTASGLGPNFAGLTNGMAFKTLGDYSFVRRLIVDGNFLYVVSAKRIDRIDLSTAPTFTATTVASQLSLVFDKNDTILDGAVSGKLGLIATSKGLFRTSNGNDISAVTTDDNKYWTLVPVPTGVVPPQQFIIASTTGNPVDFARDNGGMVQLLSAYLGSNRARINRFSVKDVSTTPIDDTTILPLPDGDIEGFNSSFITYPGYRSTFMTDGAIALQSISKYLSISPYVKTRSFRNGSSIVLDNGNATLIGPILRSSTSGSWLVAGDFGIKINE